MSEYSASQAHRIKLPLKLKLLYSTGDISTSAPLALVSFYYLFFLTDVVGMRPDLAGWVVAAGRVWDAVNDPLFGLLSDRIRSRWGRRRVLLLFGALPLGAAFGLMWLRPAFDTAGLMLYYSLTFILFDTAYTAVHVGYNSLTPELTTDYDERSSLNGYRMAYAISSALGVIILATVLSWTIQDQTVLYSTIGLVVGAVIIIPPLIVFRVTRGHTFAAPDENISLVDSLRYTVSSRPFLMVMGIYLLSWTAASVLSAVLVYYANYHLQIPEQSNNFILLAYGAAIAFIPLTVWLANRLDKRRSFIIGSLSWIAALIGIVLLSPADIAMAYILVGLSGLGIATTYVIPWSMLPDVIEYDQVRTGQRREGSYYAMAAFFQKLGTGAALWAMGQMLALSGYVTPDLSTEILVTQPPEAVAAIRWFVGPVPAVLLFGAILVAWRFPITRESHQKRLDLLDISALPGDG